MNRIRQKVTVKDVSFKKKVLQWASADSHCIYLDSNAASQPSLYGSYDALLAVGKVAEIRMEHQNAFEHLKKFQSEVEDYLFGYFSYDLKNDIEDLGSDLNDELKFPELLFFQPAKVFIWKDDQCELFYHQSVSDDIHLDLKKIEESTITQSDAYSMPPIKSRMSKQDYLDKVDSILRHIHRGDIYEVNFCQEFYIPNTRIHPLEVYYNLDTISRAPFSCFLKIDQHYLVSASPERFLKKQGNRLISQPIKGTARRAADIHEDAQVATDLVNDPKERSENIMIVDLVRNDLSKTARKGSVQVEELCEVYSFEQVHQLISTVSSELVEGIHPVEVIRSVFPMGSMTGAPKISAMKIIEDLEETKRGVYSGAIGYLTPDGDFDFNVVIRSILYNASKRYVSFSVGGAITAQSDPIKEYEECLLKARAMRTVLEE